MADMSKADRLAAARRKLQDFQRKKGGNSVHPTGATTQIQTDSGTLPPQLKKQDFHPEPLHKSADSLFVPSNSEEQPPHESVRTAYGWGDQVATNGFQAQNGEQVDNLPKSPQLHNSEYATDSVTSNAPVFSASSYFSSVGGFASDSFTGYENGPNTAQVYPSSSEVAGVPTTAHLFSQNSDEVEKWNQSPSLDLVHTSSILAESYDSSTMPDTSQHGNHPLPATDIKPTEQFESGASVVETISHGKTANECESDTIHQHDVNYEGNSNQQSENVTEFCQEVPSIPSAGTEYIQKLSATLKQYCDQSINKVDEPMAPSLASSEARNLELAAELADERRMNQQLKFSLKESQSQVSLLESKLQDLQSQQELVLARHLGPLQDQLRAHAQTVGILVGEKTELEAALMHHTTASKKHAGEVEELQSRLRASRHRVSELEKELASVGAAITTADKQKSSHVQELDQLRLQNGMLSKQLEDAEEEASELRQKLSTRNSEVMALTVQLQEKQSQLSLAQLRVTQLSASDNPQASAEIESLHQMKITLERRCTELTEAVRQLSADRDQADQQYQQYVAQLNGQIEAANAKLEAVSVENERLKSREEDLVRNMSELERQLQQQMQIHHHHQQQQQQQLQQQSQNQEEPQSADQLHLGEKITLLEEEKKNLQSSLDLESEKVTSLLIELEEKEAHIADLQLLCNEQPDQSRLLAAMESDKVAAAQATSQNTVLKQQLQELQDGFIKMSNDKLHLTESLEHEKHVNKEMGEKISQLAEELHELRILVAEKERDLQQFRGLEPRQQHEHHDCNDSSHEHDHNPSDSKISVSKIPNEESMQDASALQEQLIQAHDHIHHLNSQNSTLRRLIAQKSTESHESCSSSNATEGAITDDAAADHDTNCEESDGHTNYSSLQFAMEKLQERFSRTMGEVAELTDEKQRLEHLVLQLQGETETIGEYVALYQMQRAALQQRAREKDHQLACLSSEREELRRKLQELNHLVQRLLENRSTETAKEALTSLKISNDNQVNSDESGVIDVPVVTETIGEEINDNVSHDEAKRLISKKIMGIIEEIGSTSETEASFHPCPWCSGRLKNV